MLKDMKQLAICHDLTQQLSFHQYLQFPCILVLLHTHRQNYNPTLIQLLLISSLLSQLGPLKKKPYNYAVFSTSINSLFLDFIYEITQHLPFPFGLFHLAQCPQDPFILSQMTRFPSFWWMNNILVCGYHKLFIHLPTDEHLGCSDLPTFRRWQKLSETLPILTWQKQTQIKTRQAGRTKQFFSCDSLCSLLIHDLYLFFMVQFLHYSLQNSVSLSFEAY